MIEREKSTIHVEAGDIPQRLKDDGDLREGDNLDRLEVLEDDALGYYQQATELLIAEVERLNSLFWRVKQQAQIHSDEARCQRDTVQKVIQAGRPGMADWEDIPGMVAGLKTRAEKAEAALADAVEKCATLEELLQNLQQLKVNP